MYLYVMRQEDRLKIGITNNLERREREVTNMSGIASNVVWCKSMKDRSSAHGIETFLHRHFADHRLHGEFFSGIGLDDIVTAIDKYESDPPSCFVPSIITGSIHVYPEGHDCVNDIVKWFYSYKDAAEYLIELHSAMISKSTEIVERVQSNLAANSSADGS